MSDNPNVIGQVLAMLILFSIIFGYILLKGGH